VAAHSTFPQARWREFATLLITTLVAKSATISQSTLPVARYTITPTIAAIITRSATAQTNWVGVNPNHLWLARSAILATLCLLPGRL
jgi:hypothetical protein